MKSKEEIFKKGSKTYYNSSIFFPEDVRSEVTTLYAFVRVADDYVDSSPPDIESFELLSSGLDDALHGKNTGDQVVDDFVLLANKRSFDHSWIKAFMESMRQDLSEVRYETLEDTKRYMYGSAEVIGLMMSRIMGLPEESFDYARLLGRSMQYINFIRDIAEDNGFGRTYIPYADIIDHGLNTIDVEEAQVKEDAFNKLIRKQIDRYFIWQREAEKGFKYIPYRYRLPIKTASDMYGYTAKRIMDDPMIVYKRKVKPSKPRIYLSIIKNAVTELAR
jgi:phytoene synthase